MYMRLRCCGRSGECAGLEGPTDVPRAACIIRLSCLFVIRIFVFRHLRKGRRVGGGLRMENRTAVTGRTSSADERRTIALRKATFEILASSIIDFFSRKPAVSVLQLGEALRRVGVPGR